MERGREREEGRVWREGRVKLLSAICLLLLWLSVTLVLLFSCESCVEEYVSFSEDCKDSPLLVVLLLSVDVVVLLCVVTVSWSVLFSFSVVRSPGVTTMLGGSVIAAVSRCGALSFTFFGIERGFFHQVTEEWSVQQTTSVSGWKYVRVQYQTMNTPEVCAVRKEGGVQLILFVIMFAAVSISKPFVLSGCT